MVFPLSGTLLRPEDYRFDSSSGEYACAVLDPGQQPDRSTININNFHLAAGHYHDGLLRTEVCGTTAHTRG